MIVWPKMPDGSLYTDKIRLDKTSVLTYLDEEAALPLRYTVADICHKHNCKSVVDVGCGVGRMSEYLNVDHYMGFDDDIRLVRHGRKQYPDRDIRVASWKEETKLKVDYKVDCLLLLGVLSYAMPEFPEVYEKNGNHKEVFHTLVDLFDPKLIIIQEILKEQTHVAESNQLRVLPLDYYMNFDPTYLELDLPIWCGKRAILEIDRTNIK